MTGPVACRTYAHPDLLMIGPDGAPLPTHAVQGGYENGDQPSDLVTIPANSVRYAVLVFAYNNPDTGVLCGPHATYLDVTVAPRSTIRIPAPTSNGHPMNPCDGIVYESPVGAMVEVFGTDP